MVRVLLAVRTDGSIYQLLEFISQANQDTNSHYVLLPSSYEIRYLSRSFEDSGFAVKHFVHDILFFMFSERMGYSRAGTRLKGGRNFTNQSEDVAPKYGDMYQCDCFKCIFIDWYFCKTAIVNMYKS